MGDDAVLDDHFDDDFDEVDGPEDLNNYGNILQTAATEYARKKLEQMIRNYLRWRDQGRRHERWPKREKASKLPILGEED